MSSASTGLLKSSALLADFICLCETVIATFPDKFSWEERVCINNPYAIFFANKITEIINLRFLPQINNYLNSPIPVNKENIYETFFSLADEDFFETSDTQHRYGIIDSGGNLCFFQESSGIGLSLSDKLTLFPMFDLYGFYVWCYAEELENCKKDDIKSLAYFVAKDLLDADPDFLSIGHDFWQEVCVSSNYSESDVSYYIFKSKLVHSFLEWNRTMSLDRNIVLCDKCLSLISELQHSCINYSTAVEQVRCYETQEAWYLIYAQTYDSYLGENVDVKYVYPHTFYQLLLLNVLLEELNNCYGFYVSKEEVITCV